MLAEPKTTNRRDWLCFKAAVSFFIRMKAQTLVDNLSELMVDASLGTIQCLEEIVSNSFMTLIWFISVFDYQLKYLLAIKCVSCLVMYLIPRNKAHRVVTIQTRLCRCRSFLAVAAISSPPSCRFCGRGLLAKKKPLVSTGELRCYCWAWLHGETQFLSYHNLR